MKSKNKQTALLVLMALLLLALPLLLTSCAAGAKPKSAEQYQEIGKRLAAKLADWDALHDYQAEISDLEKAVSAAPAKLDKQAAAKLADQVFELAVLYDRRAGDATNAVKYYQRFLQLARTHEFAPYAMVRQAELLEKLGDTKQAEKIYSTVLMSSAKALIPVGDDLHLERVEITAGKRYDALVHDHFLYKMMDFFVAATGRNPHYSHGLAVILLAVLFRVLLYPFTKKQLTAMQDMQRVKPLVDEANRKFKGDKERLNKEIMAIYQREGVNPLSGCLPLLVQLPVIFILYKAIRLYNYQFTHASFLWIKHLSDPDIPLLIIYVVSMAATQFYTTFSADEEQRKQNLMMAILMPAMLAYFFYWFPAAFILFWIALNLAMSYQQILMRRKSAQLKTAGGPELSASEQPRKVNMSEDTSPAAVRRKRRERRKKS